MLRYVAIAVVGFSFLTACTTGDDSEFETDDRAAVVTQIVVRWYTSEQVREGERVFRENCAACHGARAEGDPNWRSRGPDGKFPPPPLNGTAHGWHHPLAQLRHVIKNGGDPRYENMPAWGGTLSDAEIDAAIAWFQSHWPDEIYQTWLEIDSRAPEMTSPRTG